MLTIKNYNKLVRQSVGGGNWFVRSCDEEVDWYRICIDHMYFSSITISLSRIPNVYTGEYAVMNGDNDPQFFTLSAQWLSDMNNLLKTLNYFTI